MADAHRPSRREFLALASALGLTPFQPGSPQPVAGRGGLIDVHHHLLPQQWAIEKRDLILDGGDPSVLQWTPAKSIDEMDRHGVALALLSITGPGVWFGNIDEGRRFARMTNEFAARMVAEHPNRFGFFAAVPAPDTAGSLREMEFAFDTLKADGVGFMSNYEGRYLGDPIFAPIFAELQRRRAVVYVHPTPHPCCRNIVPGLPGPVLESPFDTTRTIASLLYAEAFTRYPAVRFIFPHGGGTVAFLANRLTRGSAERLAQLKRLYFDLSGALSDNAIAALLALMPVSQLLFGSDFPYVTAMASGMQALRALEEGGRLTSVNARRIERDNAVSLFPRLGAARA